MHPHLLSVDDLAREDIERIQVQLVEVDEVDQVLLVARAEEESTDG